MGSSRPPFRADHVGSLLRPPALKALRLKKESGQASAHELAAAEDAAIREVVRFQEDVGLEGVTDGELRRKSWHMDFLLQFGGLESAGKTLPVTFHGPTGDVFFTRPDLQVASRITRPRPIDHRGQRGRGRAAEGQAGALRRAGPRGVGQPLRSHTGTRRPRGGRILRHPPGCSEFVNCPGWRDAERLARSRGPRRGRASRGGVPRAPMPATSPVPARSAQRCARRR